MTVRVAVKTRWSRWRSSRREKRGSGGLFAPVGLGAPPTPLPSLLYTQNHPLLRDTRCLEESGRHSCTAWKINRHRVKRGTETDSEERERVASELEGS